MPIALQAVLAMLAVVTVGNSGRTEPPAASSAIARPTASGIIERSIAYHDPQGHWGRARFRLHLAETRPDGSQRSTILVIDQPEEHFEIATSRQGARIEGALSGGRCTLMLDGSTDFSDAERERFRLTCDRLAWLRDYYTYLWGLPMKLRDPGTRIDPRVEDAQYRHQPVWAVRVTYDETVGSDTWYFYFDRQTCALIGYRFYHDEGKGDGEHIVLEGETEVDSLRLPTTRAWYTNAESRHLGTDTLESIEIRP
jgi:hypothetical protein